MINRALLSVLFIFYCSVAWSLDSDKKADFILEGDNFKNLPSVDNGVSKIKYWGNVAIEQGTLKIRADDAVVYNGSEGISKVVLTGQPVELQQIVDAEFGKLDVKADKVDFMVIDDLLLLTGRVVIKSKIQGQMSGEKITMNLKTKEIKGVKSENKRVKLVIKPKSTP